MAAKIALNGGAYVQGPCAENPMTLEQFLRHAAEAGYEGVELPGAPPLTDPETLRTAQGRKDLLAAASSHGLDICAFGPRFTDLPPLSSNPEVRMAAINRFQEAADLCDECGIRVLRVDTAHPPRLPEGLAYDQTLANLIDTWKRFAAIAAERNLRIAWEFEPGFLFNKPSEILTLLDEVDSPHFGVMYDTCHAEMCAVVGARQLPPTETLPGGQAQLLKTLKGRLHRIHLIDSDHTLHNNDTSAHAAFGEGLLDFDKLLPQIVESGYSDPWWAVDLCFNPRTLELSAPSREFVDGLLRRHGLRD